MYAPRSLGCRSGAARRGGVDGRGRPMKGVLTQPDRKSSKCLTLRSRAGSSSTTTVATSAVARGVVRDTWAAAGCRERSCGGLALAYDKGCAHGIAGSPRLGRRVERIPFSGHSCGVWTSFWTTYRAASGAQSCGSSLVCLSDPHHAPRTSGSDRPGCVPAVRERTLSLSGAVMTVTSTTTAVITTGCAASLRALGRPRGGTGGGGVAWSA